MTKDSICKDCKHRGYARRKYESVRGELKESIWAWCGKKVIDDPDCGIIIECSEYEYVKRIKKDEKIPAVKPEQFQRVG